MIQIRSSDRFILSNESFANGTTRSSALSPFLCNPGSPPTSHPPAMLSPLHVVAGVCALVGLALLWRDVRSKMRGEGRTARSLLSHYVAVKAAGWLGKLQRCKLEMNTRNVRQVQEETLLRRLAANQHTVYGRQFDFRSIKGQSEQVFCKLFRVR